MSCVTEGSEVIFCYLKYYIEIKYVTFCHWLSLTFDFLIALTPNSLHIHQKSMLIANSIQSNICCNFFNKVEETLKYTLKLLLVIVSKLKV